MARWIDRAGSATTAVVLGVSIVSMLILPVLAYGWMQLPFMGAFVEQTLVFNSVGPRGGTPWAAIDTGLRFPDRLIMIAGQPVRDTVTLSGVLAARRPGDTVELAYLDSDGRQRLTSITLQTFPLEDTFAYFVLPYLIAWAYLAIGGWVFYVRWGEMTGRAFVLFCVGMAIAVGGLFDLYTTHAFSPAWTFGIPLAAGALITLALVFPQEHDLVLRYPVLRWLGFVPTLVLAGLGEAALYDFQRPTAYADAWRNGFAFAGLSILVFLGFMVYRNFRAPSPIMRGQARVILLGSALAFGPLLYYLVLTTANVQIVFNVSVYFPPLVIFPLAVAFAILRFRLLDTNRIIGRGLVYAAVTLVAGIGYTAIIALASIVTERAVAVDNPFVVAVLLVVLVLALDPLRYYLQRWVDSTFWLGSRAYRERLQEFGRDLTTAADLEQVLRSIHKPVQDVVRPAHVHVFLHDRVTGEFVGHAPEAGEVGSKNKLERAALDARRGEPDDQREAERRPGPARTGIRFPADCDLARALAGSRGSIYLAPDLPLPSSLTGDREHLARLGANVFIPLHGESGLAGWLALGPKLSGGPYSREDFWFLESLGDQSALAVERANLFEETRRHEQQLTIVNALAREMTGLVGVQELCRIVAERLCRALGYYNISLFSVDRASRQVVLEGAAGARASLARPGEYRPAFGEGFVGRVAESGETLLVNDTRQRPEFVALKGLDILSELVLPLKVGGQVIGVLDVDSSQVNTFDESDVATLSIVGDQLAVALEKARLFEQTQQRTTQLSTLNEIGRAVSTLLDVEGVLEVIYQQVKRSLTLDAFFVALYDPEGEMVSYPLVYDGGQPYQQPASRLTEESNLGRVIRAATPRLVNRAAEELAAQARPVQPVGNAARLSASLLYAPLVVGSRVIGALSAQSYALNAYKQEHLDLLNGAAQQAAIAIQNARLFEAEREQREIAEAMRDTAAAINSTLNLDEVLGRILANVGRVVPHDSASILLVDAGVARTAKWRRSEHHPYPAVVVSFQVDQVPTLRQMAETGRPLIVASTPDYPDWVDLAETRWVRSYVGAPIRRKGQVIGFLNLNSAQAGFFTPGHSEHLMTFADQAGVAIENAQLFNELQLSNADLALAYVATLEGWSRALELRDQATEGHTQRVTEMTLRLARAFHLSQEETLHLYHGALMHDIGKMGIPDSILLKPGPLNDEEWQIMRRHPVYAYELLSPIDYLRPGLDIPYCHHEKWDGTGYPRGLKDEAIPLAARIFAVADVWDALRSDRPYRQGWSREKVREHIGSLSGTHFDPKVVRAFFDVLDADD